MRKNRDKHRRSRSMPLLLLLLLCTFMYCQYRNQGGPGLEQGNVTDTTSAALEESTSAAVVETTAAELPAETKASPEHQPEQGIPYYQPLLWEGELPAAYDRRMDYQLPAVKDQGELGTCWAFAALMALESALSTVELMDFSEDHMSNNENFILSQSEGGEYTMALAYLLSWQGPVPEALDPYGDGVSPPNLKAVMHLQEAQFLPVKDYEAIKTAVYLRGGVQSSLYTQLKNAESQSRYYDKTNAAYCYDGDAVPNHEIVIVGWDDDFPRERFSIDVPEDGAFLCVNSWGSSFGDGGYFYVSYYDTNIGVHNVLYTRIESADNYDYIYQSDLCGWIGALGYGENEAWAANVYQAGSREYLRAAGFYAVSGNTDYELYVVRNVGSEPDFAHRQLLAAGSVEYSGYYTVPVNYEGMLAQDERFAIVMKLISAEGVHPIAIEYDAGDGKSRIDLSDGEGYISMDGDIWESAEESQNCNLCLKAYTDRR